MLKAIVFYAFIYCIIRVKLSSSLRPAQLLLAGDGPQHGQSNHIGPALLFRMEHIHSYLLDLATLYREPGRLPEEACIQVSLQVVFML